MNQQILKLKPSDKGSLGAVRHFPDLMAAADNDAIWVKGIVSANPLIKQLPAVATYTLDDQNRLFPKGGVTPVGQLPSLEWQTLPEFIPVELPATALPGNLPEKLPVQLVPATTAQQGAALLTNLAVWKHYADTAPQVRLQQLQFAVSEHQEVLIIGTPLPGIPGKEYWKKGTLFIPAGFDFEVPVAADLMEKKYNAAKDALILLATDGKWQKIDLKHLVTASRSAARLSPVQQEVD